jgi:hypothetical protein
MRIYEPNIVDASAISLELDQESTPFTAFGARCHHGLWQVPTCVIDYQTQAHYLPMGLDLDQYTSSLGVAMLGASS